MRVLLNVIVFLVGAGLIAAGALGEYQPNPLVGPEGLFLTNTAHNYLHTAAGALLCLSALVGRPLPGLWLTTIAFIVITMLGYLSGTDMLLGQVHVNELGRHLHAAVVALLGLLIIACTRAQPI